MPEKTRGLHVTSNIKGGCSMSQVTIKFIDKEYNEDPGKIADNIMNAIDNIMQISIKEYDYYKNNKISNFKSNSKFAEISFCLTQACSEQEILRFVQNLFLDLMGFNLRRKECIEAVGTANILKMEEELEEAKNIIKNLLLDITLNPSLFYLCD